LALIEGCKHAVEITIPADAFEAETAKALEKVQKKVHLKGFRPGKAPLAIVKQHYMGEVRQEALDKLIPQYLQKEYDRQNLQVVSRPDVKDLDIAESGEVKFKAEFEVAPEFELAQYKGVEVPYEEPAVNDADIDERLNHVRDSKSQFVDVDPRPAVDGDQCLVDLASIAGLDGEPMTQENINIEIGGKDTFTEFSEALRGATPGEAREAEVTYPEHYAAERLSGKTVRFRIELKQIRLKELPELNDEFAKDLGDFQTLDELRAEVRKTIYHEREHVAQAEAKNTLVEKLVDLHSFPVPDAFVDQQVRSIVEGQLQQLAGQGVDVKKLNLDWAELRKSQAERATRDVRASLIVEKISSAESIFATQEEVDAELSRISRQQREPIAALRMKFEKDGTLGRIASHIRTEKTLSYLFEHAVKTRPEPKPAAAEGAAEAAPAGPAAAE
jgi:trigger factor